MESGLTLDYIIIFFPNEFNLIRERIIDRLSLARPHVYELLKVWEYTPAHPRPCHLANRDNRYSAMTNFRIRSNSYNQLLHVLTIYFYRDDKLNGTRKKILLDRKELTRTKFFTSDVKS